MAVKPIPDGYHTVTPYLIVEGADTCIEFLENAFGAKVRFRMARSDGTVGHAEVEIGDSVVMIGDVGAPASPMSASIHLYVEDCDATYRRALDAGGASLREPEDMFYGDRTAGVKDPAGNQWWLATHIEDVSEEEIAKRAQEQQPA